MEIDETVAELYGILDEELKEVKKALRILKGRDKKEGIMKNDNF